MIVLEDRKKIYLKKDGELIPVRLVNKKLVGSKVKVEISNRTYEFLKKRLK